MARRGREVLNARRGERSLEVEAMGVRRDMLRLRDAELVFG